ncbi:MAG: YbhB/YbcL family Raf kinase inhibitor-like protein [Dehalococcoidales bacterium]|nr:YbhB/YbcL family Raf kinase inhibitor-like protein [Dehalococcoidales bacterium]
MSIFVTSPEFNKGENIPPIFTGDGDNISPRLEWNNIPENTKSLALIMDDPDAPSGTFTHWVIFNIPADSLGIPEANTHNPQLPDGSLQGSNSTGGIGYYGPYPPAGSRHRYYFALYALDEKLDLKSRASKEQLLKAMEGHILDRGRLFGIYQRMPNFPMG